MVFHFKKSRNVSCCFIGVQPRVDTDSITNFQAIFNDFYGSNIYFMLIFRKLYPSCPHRNGCASAHQNVAWNRHEGNKGWHDREFFGLNIK
jgi:hypothetical protein